MRKKVSSWKVLGGGGPDPPLGHFDPGVIRGRLGFVSPFVLSVSFVVFASFLFGCLRSLRTTYYRLRTTHYTLPVPCYLLIVLATYYLQPISYDWRCTSYYCYSYDLILIICYLVAYDRW